MQSRYLSTVFCAVPLLLLPCAPAQDKQAAPPSAANTISVQANLVVVPAVVYDKKGLVKDLTKDSFALTVDGKPQVIRYFDRDTDVPLTVGLLVDVSRSQSSVLDDEERRARRFWSPCWRRRTAPAPRTRPS